MRFSNENFIIVLLSETGSHAKFQQDSTMGVVQTSIIKFDPIRETQFPTKIFGPIKVLKI